MADENKAEIDVFEADAARAYASLTDNPKEQDKDDFDFEPGPESANSSPHEADKLPETIESTRRRSSRQLPSIPLAKDRRESSSTARVSQASSSSISLRSDAVRHSLAGQALLVYGPPGGCKSRLVRRLVAEIPAVFTKVITHTTRRRLVDEIDGKDYYFVSNREFDELVNKNEFVEHAHVKQNRPENTRGLNRYQKAASIESLDGIETEVIENRYGTTERALLEARRVNSPCVVMVLDMDGARHWMDQRENVGMKLHFVFVRNVRTFCHPLDMFHAKVVVDKDMEEAFKSIKSHALSAVQYDEESPRAQLLEAQAEWSAVETIQPSETGSVNPVQKTRLVTYSELLNYFQTVDLSQQAASIIPVQRRSGVSAITHVLFAPKLLKSLHRERNLVFSMGLYGFNNSQMLHIRVLQTIYRKLMGTSLDCARFGSHWQVIGFQGADPATDLRGTGFLGLVHLIYLVMDEQRLRLALEIFQLSQDKVQNFPFCALSINVTRIALQCLRQGVLTRECNRRQEVLGVVNEFYTATLYHLYYIWRHQKKTITDTGFVLREVESWVRKNPSKVLKNLKSILTAKQSARKGVEFGVEIVANQTRLTKIGHRLPVRIG
ncbi:uncharacterized protein [Oscarella lobularis]|uniref:uncharacterized protein n=1 Tax=Oscarella lobularis TaxID=121494 RepID=UPI003313E2D4